MAKRLIYPFGKNHDRFVQVFKNRVGQVFSTGEIKDIMQRESDIAPGSIRPNDHGEGNKSACKCAGTKARIFERVALRALFKVRRCGVDRMKFAITLEKDEDGFIVVSCPALPGCHSQGRTKEEAIANIGEAIRGYIASMRKHGEPVPSATEVEEVEVAV